MRFEAATIKDIAKAVGVSTSTVSRALRDSYEISDITKQLIIDYAKTINYKPNPAALCLKAKKTKSIGIIVPEVSSSFFSQVINGVECVARNYGYNVIIAQSFENYITEMDNTSFLASRSIDGCLVSVSAETNNYAHFTNLQDKGFPIVFFDRIVEGIEGHTVTLDNTQGTYEVIKHLLQNNYKRIAFVANSADLYITRKRLEGYEKALAEYDIYIDESLVKYCKHGGMYAKEVNYVFDELFFNTEKPDAIFTSIDELTFACMRYCRQHQIAIPDDVALTGFSNLEITDLLCPSLTFVKQPSLRMGKLAAQLLIKTIESKRPVIEYEHIVLPAELKVGESSMQEVYS